MKILIILCVLAYAIVSFRKLNIKGAFRVKVMVMPKGLYEIFKYPGDYYVIKYTTNGMFWNYVKQAELPGEYPTICVGKFKADQIDKIMPLNSIEDIRRLEKSLSKPTYEMIQEREKRREEKAKLDSILLKHNK